MFSSAGRLGSSAVYQANRQAWQERATQGDCREIKIASKSKSRSQLTSKLWTCSPCAPELGCLLQRLLESHGVHRRQMRRNGLPRVSSILRDPQGTGR